MKKVIKYGLNLMTWNCGKGFLKKQKITEVAHYMDSLNISIGAVSEVDINNTNEYSESMYNIPNFFPLFPKSWVSSKKSRIIAYCKNELRNNIKLREDLMTEKQPDIWIQIQIGKGNKFLVGMLYREWTSIDGKGSYNDQIERLTELINMAEKAAQENVEIILMGDMNINIKNLDDKREQRELSRLINNLKTNFNLTQLVQDYTRSRVVKGNLQKSIIDHVYTNMPENITDLKLTNTASSDHAIIHFTRKTCYTGHTEQVQERRCFKYYFKDIFKEELAYKNWEAVLGEQDVDRAVEMLSKNITSVLDRHAPVKTFTMKSPKKKTVSNETKKEIIKRDKLSEEYKRLKSEDSKLAWIASKNKVVGLLKRDNNRMNSQNLNTPNKAWQHINNNRGPRAIRGGPPTKLVINGSETNNSKKIAEEMNRFFINKIKKNREKIEQKNAETGKLKDLEELAEPENLGFEIKEVSEGKVLNIITHMRKTKGCGADNISNKVIYDCREVILKPLTHIINMSIRQSKYPKAWKIAKTIPLHKKGSKQLASNYRPIALLSKLSLVYEKIIHEQINNHFEENNLFHQNQHGYLKNRSCMTALLTIYDKWARAVNEKKIVGVLCMDLTAAFDLVDKEILVKKLGSYGAGTKTQRWIKNYMEGRKQFVVVNTTKSSILNVNWGVPQGSRLGPLLFLIFVNDMMKVVKYGSCEMYADDSAITVMGNSTSEIQTKLEENARKVTHWLDENYLMLAPEKSELMVVCNKYMAKQIQNFEIQVEGKTIKQKEYIKLLGITLNNNLSFSKYIDGENAKGEKSLIQTLSNRLWLIQSMRKNMTENTCRMLMNGLFWGKMCYGMELYAGQNKNTIKQLQLLENRAVKIVTGKKACKETRDRCKWLTIENTLKKQTLMTIYKIRTEQQPSYLRNQVMNDRAKVSSKIPQYEQVQTADLKNSFISRATTDWNKLPQDLRELSPKKFKKALIIHLRSMEPRD